MAQRVTVLTRLGLGFGAVLVSGASVVAPPTKATAAERGASQVPRLPTCASLRNRIPPPPRFVVNQYPIATIAAVPIDDSPPRNRTESSFTNVQVPGVDEPDLVENDGKLLYSVVDGDLRVYDLSRRAQVARVAFDWSVLGLFGSTPSETQTYQTSNDGLLLVGTSLVVVAPPRIGPGGLRSAVAVYDVSSPTAPTLRSQFRLTGELVSVRASGGKVLFVTANSLDTPTKYAEPEDFRNRASVDQTNKANAELAADPSQWLPAVVADGKRLAVACDEVLAPLGTEDGRWLVGLFRLDLVGPAGPKAYPVALAATLLSAPVRGSAGYTTADSFILPMEIYGEASAARGLRFGTALLRFDWPTSGTLRAIGHVPGSLLDQFAIDEFDGALRVATTTLQGQIGFDDFQQSAIYVLETEGDQMVERGRAEGLGPGEIIRSVRFVGGYGFVVTFRQVDPLYTVKFTDPARPIVVGELKVRGYSDYLHPLGTGLLLGVGQDADAATGSTWGARVALFDVADSRRPRQVSALQLGDRGRRSTSEAEVDWHAFLWWPASSRRGTAVIPVTTRGSTRTGRFFERSEVAVLAVNGRTLRRTATLRHPSEFDDPSATSTIRRSLVMGRGLITVSSAGVMVNDLTSLRPVAWIPSD